MGKHVMVRRCVKCAVKLDSNDIAYSDGVCPSCGHRSPSTHRGQHGHHLIAYTEAVEYQPGVFERLKKLFG